MKIISVLVLLATSQVTSFSLTPKNNKPVFNNPLKSLSQTQDVTKDLSKKSLATILGSFLLLSSNLSPILPGGDALAASGGSRVIGEIAGSGIVFKDTLTVESFDDPKVQGVTLYISNFQRPLNERLQKDFFNDPSFASVSCAKTGPISVADNIAIGKQGEEVFEESKSLLFKQLRVQVRSSSFYIFWTFLRWSLYSYLSVIIFYNHRESMTKRRIQLCTFLLILGLIRIVMTINLDLRALHVQFILNKANKGINLKKSANR